VPRWAELAGHPVGGVGRSKRVVLGARNQPDEQRDPIRLRDQQAAPGIVRGAFPIDSAGVAWEEKRALETRRHEDAVEPQGLDPSGAPLTVLGSRAFGVLVGCHKLLKKSGNDLHLSGLSPHLRTVLEVSGWTEVFPNHERRGLAYFDRAAERV
jgi:hypothetical protein